MKKLKKTQFLGVSENKRKLQPQKVISTSLTSSVVILTEVCANYFYWVTISLTVMSNQLQAPSKCTKRCERLPRDPILAWIYSTKAKSSLKTLTAMWWFRFQQLVISSVYSASLGTKLPIWNDIYSKHRVSYGTKQNGLSVQRRRRLLRLFISSPWNIWSVESPYKYSKF